MMIIRGVVSGTGELEVLLLLLLLLGEGLYKGEGIGLTTNYFLNTPKKIIK